MKKRAICIIFSFVLIYSGCTSLKRYKSASVSGTDNSLVDVNLFRASLESPSPGNSGKTLWDLSADAQTQYIKILNSRYPANEQFLHSLSLTYLNWNKENIAADYSVKDLRLIFSVSRVHDYEKKDAFHKSRLSPADRIEYLMIKLVLKDTILSFKGWNRYATEYGTIDIGDVSFSRSLDVNAAGSYPAKKEESAASRSGESKASVSSKEDQSLKYRYVILNGRISANSIQMEEEGTREIDLAGNIIADISLSFRSTTEILTRISGLRDSTGTYNPPSKITVENLLVNVPDMEKKISEVKADLIIDYVYRNVQSGRKTFGEWDDRVKYYKGHHQKSVVLFSSSDYVPGFCGIGFSKNTKENQFVTADMGNGNPYPIIFATSQEASAFNIWLFNWLRSNPGKSVRIGGQLLKTGSDDLTWERIKDQKDFGVMSWFR